MYYVSHYDKKQFFAHMGELGLMLDPEDFATNGYQVVEREHSRTASKAFGRKGKAIVPSEDKDEGEEQEEEDCAGAGTSQGAENDNDVNLSDDEEYMPTSGDNPLLTGAQLISSIADVEALVQKRNVIAPRTLFVEEPVVEAVDPPSSGLAMETRMAKRAKQSCADFVAGASLLTPGDDFQSSKIHNLEERLDRMNQLQLEMQA